MLQSPSQQSMKRAFIALCLTAILWSCSPAASDDATGTATAADDATEQASAQAAHAEALYARTCAACHDHQVGGAPLRSAIERRSPGFIKAAMDTGLMRAQAAQLSGSERSMLAEHLGRNVARNAAQTAGPRCEGTLAFHAAPLWNRWGNGLTNARFQSSRDGGITAEDAPRLELAWAFAFPESSRARSQPAVTREAIFVGSQSGLVYALDTASGCIWWSYDAGAEVRSAPTISTDANGRPQHLFFGDFAGTVHAVDALTGERVWAKSVRDHPDGTITGSVTLHRGRLFVPMSSSEVVSAINPQYICCSFRGGVTALDADDGTTLWRMHSTAPAEPGLTNASGIRNQGPSGAPVWSTPTVDARRGLIYVGTGENYSTPANGMSDAIIAIDQATGRVVWVRQTVSGDAWNAACGRAQGANCPSEDGPDFDFGAPPILVRLASGQDIILAGQKSGMVYGFDPNRNGAILWQRRVGMGGWFGGIHWGMASDGRTLFVGIVDTPGHSHAVGPGRQGIHAFDVATGNPRWSRIEPRLCAEQRHECQTSLSAAVTVTPDLVFAGALNGRLNGYSSRDGRVLWSTETNREFRTVNGVAGHGGSIDSAGPVVAGGMVIVNSGYDKFGEIAGNVLLVYRARPQGAQQ